MNREYKSVYISFIILGILLITPYVSSKIDPEKQKLIDEFVETLLGCRELVSINLAVVEGNETVLSKGYGISNLDTGSLTTNETLYGLASLSKAFASTLLGHVLQSSNFTWDTPVRTILGDDFYFSEWELTEHATLRDVLAHQMGVPSHNKARMQDDLDRELLSHKMRYFDRVQSFRDSYRYNNLMYGLISYITEVVGGSSWETLMEKHIFTPLGMTSSTFTHVIGEQEASEKMAVSYLFDYDGSWRAVSHTMHSEWGELGGSGSIVSNAEDMLKWLSFQLTHGQNMEGEQVVSQEVVEATHERVKVIPHGTDDALYRRPNSPVSYIMDEYGMGWRRGYYRGYTMILHTGTSYGYGALLTTIPDANIAISTSISGPDSGYRARRALHMYVLDLLTGAPPFLNTSSACTYPDTRTRRPLHMPSDELTGAAPEDDIYEGQYGNFGYGNISVKFNNTRDRLQLLYGVLGVWDLYSTPNNHTFAGKGIGDIWHISLSEIIFSGFSEDEGTMTTLTIPPFEWLDPPVFSRDLQMSEAPRPDGPCIFSQLDTYESVLDKEIP